MMMMMMMMMQKAYIITCLTAWVHATIQVQSSYCTEIGVEMLKRMHICSVNECHFLSLAFTSCSSQVFHSSTDDHSYQTTHTLVSCSHFHNQVICRILFQVILHISFDREFPTSVSQDFPECLLCVSCFRWTSSPLKRLISRRSIRFESAMMDRKLVVAGSSTKLSFILPMIPRIQRHLSVIGKKKETHGSALRLTYWLEFLEKGL